MTVAKIKSGNTWKGSWLAIGILLSIWTIPAMISTVFHLCPMRPDGARMAQAMPNWARKYGIECSVCHTTVPSLTRAGYLFRSAGFRMPDEYGQNAKFNGLKDMYAARIREEYRIKQVTGGTSPSDTNGFAFHELTFYPISGAIGKWWAAESELTFAVDEHTEVENAYVKAAYPHKDWLFTARAGIFHPFEGYGASDRPVSNIRPLFQVQHAKNGSFDTGTQIWNQDQQGAELGASYKDTRLTLAILNGFAFSTDSAGNVTGNANGANGTVPGSTDADKNKRDYLLFLNHLIGDKAALSAEYLNGNTTITRDTAGNTVTAFNNNYWRSAFYGNYKVLGDKLDVLAGYELGRDHYIGPGDASSDGTFMNNGWFGEFRSKLADHFTAGFRYDTFKPNRSANDNRLQAYTLTGAIPFNEIKFLIDAQVKKTEKTNPTSDQWDKLVRLEWMVIF